MKRRKGDFANSYIGHPVTDVAHMKVGLIRGDLFSHDTPLLVLPVFQGEARLEGAAARADELIGGAFGRARKAGDFKGKEEDFFLHYRSEEGGPTRIAFVGAGRREDADAEVARKVAARAVRRAESLSLTSIAVHVPVSRMGGVEVGVQAAAEGGVLAAWDFRELKSTAESRSNGDGPDQGDDGKAQSSGEDAPPPLVNELWIHPDGESDGAERSLKAGAAFAEGENLARLLQWRPGNVATPAHLASVALSLAEEHGFTSRILGPGEMEAERMGALLSVAAGSEQEPRLIVLEHHGGEEGDSPIALVGKGLTFDSGGISIKPSLGMEDMKYDMSGGAAVLGAMKAIGVLDLPLNVVGVVPASENLLSGKATKPGDVIRTRAGKTVEIINTDAEGRLILADALSYVVDRYRPDAVLDCATLTGACVLALGHHAAAVLGNDEELIEEVRAAGDRASERCWPLPLWKPYRKQLESPVADLKNVGGRPAGTITAAWFLSEFVGDARWAHLDIAGTAYGEPRAPYHRKGGLGFPTRLLLEWVRSRVR